MTQVTRTCLLTDPHQPILTNTKGACYLKPHFLFHNQSATVVCNESMAEIFFIKVYKYSNKIQKTDILGNIKGLIDTLWSIISYIWQGIPGSKQHSYRKLCKTWELVNLSYFVCWLIHYLHHMVIWGNNLRVAQKPI